MKDIRVMAIKSSLRNFTKQTLLNKIFFYCQFIQPHVYDSVSYINFCLNKLVTFLTFFFKNYKLLPLGINKMVNKGKLLHDKLLCDIH